MRYSIQIQGKLHSLTIEADAAGVPIIALDDHAIPLSVARIGTDRLSLLIDGQSYEAFVRSLPSDSPTDTRRYEVMLDGAPHVVELVDERRRALSGMARSRNDTTASILKAPMPGLVVRVLVQPGEMVERGQRLLILEAMKMQNDLPAPRSGLVRAVKTAQGQAVNQGQPLIVIGDAES